MEIIPPEIAQMTTTELERRALEIIARLPEIQQTEEWAEWGFTDETYELDCIRYAADLRYSYNGDMLDHMRPGDERESEIYAEDEVLQRIMRLSPA